MEPTLRVPSAKRSRVCCTTQTPKISQLVVKPTGRLDVDRVSRSFWSGNQLSSPSAAIPSTAGSNGCPKPFTIEVESVRFVAVGSALAGAPLGALVMKTDSNLHAFRGRVRCDRRRAARQGDMEGGLHASVSGSQNVCDTPYQLECEGITVGPHAGKPHALESAT